MTHNEHIPNWQLFKFKFEPSLEFVRDIESRLDILAGTPEYEAVAKHINVQIGILNLRDREMAQEAMKEFGELFKSS